MPTSSPFEDEGIVHVNISAMHVDIESICEEGPIGS